MKNVEDIYPLSPIQQGMLFHILAEPRSSIYIGQYVFQLRGNLQPELLKQAWQETLNHHPALRTIFLWEGLEQPLQVVRQKVELIWDDENWRSKSLQQINTDRQQLLLDELNKGFKLDQAPLMRLKLIQLKPDYYELIWICHHLIADGWSTTLIWNDLCQAYADILSNKNQKQSGNSAPAPSYKRYVAWLKKQDLSQAQVFWQETLKGFSEINTLPLDEFAIEKQSLQQQDSQNNYQETEYFFPWTYY